MAREKDVTRRPKFFARKKNVTDEQLCEKCRHHRFVILVRFGCDAVMHTRPGLRSYEIANLVDEGKYLHFWCLNEDDVPDCLQHYTQVKAV